MEHAFGFTKPSGNFAFFLALAAGGNLIRVGAERGGDGGHVRKGGRRTIDT